MRRSEQDRRIARSWDENAGVWTDAIRAGALESRRLVTDDAILEAVLELPGQRILDVGCGEGWLARRLAESGRAVVAFDGSSKLIERAGNSRGAAFTILDYDTFAAEPERVGGHFDIAVCNFSLLSDDVQPLLTAIRRIAHPSGHLLIQTVHPVTAVGADGYEDGWREEAFESLPGQWTTMPWYFRTLGSWIRELRSAGWTIDDCREPVHPDKGTPASLILRSSAGSFGRSRDNVPPPTA